MTTTAPRGGRRPFPQTAFDAQSCLDAAFVRDALLNNALHMADSGGAPVWVNEMTADNSKISGNPALYIAPAGGAASTWTHLTVYGPFSLPVHADRHPYQVRVRLYGASASGGTSVKFAVTLGPAAALESVTYATGADSIEFTATTSATPAWLTPSVPASDLITPPPWLVEASLTPESTTDDTGGSIVLTGVYEVLVHVWGYSSGTGADQARLYGLHVACFVGP